MKGVGVLNREYGFLAEMLFGAKGRSAVTYVRNFEEKMAEFSAKISEKYFM